jgi:hypothetical protein
MKILIDKTILVQILALIQTDCKQSWGKHNLIEVIKEALAQPAQREWVGLTDDELADLWYKESLDWMEFARAHEAALKEKNT